MAVMTYREAIHQALREEMQRDERVFVDRRGRRAYDGAYEVTKGLLKEFGPRRVVDTPIAESGFTGVGDRRGDGRAAAGGRDDDVQLRACSRSTRS